MRTDTKPKARLRSSSIEKTYGSRWRTRRGCWPGEGPGNMELVSFLKSEQPAQSGGRRLLRQLVAHHLADDGEDMRPAAGDRDNLNGRIQLNDFICNCHADRV
jgi:hypothetical protein